MAITTYGELKTAVENWLARTDQSGRTPEFIALAEAEINRRLNIREMISRATASTTAGEGYIALPTSSANFLRLIRLQYASSGELIMLTFLPAHQLAFEYPDATTGKPVAYSVVGSEIQLRPVPNAAYTLEATYMNRVSALSDSNTPVLFTNNPDLYLYGALKHAMPFINEMDEAARFQQFATLFEAAIESQRQADMRARYGGAPLVTRSDVGNP
jgi:hypothetical protein